MRVTAMSLILIGSLLTTSSSTAELPKNEAKDAPTAATAEVQISWFGTLSRGLAEAQRTGKPILFISAAPHCAGVSGMW